MPAKKTIERAEEQVSAIGESVAVHVKDALHSAGDWKETAEDYIKRSPGMCLAGAFILGVLIAKVARHA